MTGDDGHPILTTVGIVAVVVGLLMVFQPEVAAAIGTGYVAVTVVGLLALVQALRVAQARRATELRAAETPDVETIASMPTPGDEFDRTVAELGSGPRRVLVRERTDIRKTLKEAALTAVADRENCSREQAGERVEAGTWTDDPYAASFLGGERAPSPSALSRLRVAVSSEPTSQHRIRRTADAVARTAGVEPGDSPEEGDGRRESPDDGGDDSATGARTNETGGGTTPSGSDESARTEADA